jgi:hypothetical protein
MSIQKKFSEMNVKVSFLPHSLQSLPLLICNLLALEFQREVNKWGKVGKVGSLMTLGIVKIE